MHGARIDPQQQQRFEATLKQLRLNDIEHIQVLKEPDMAQRPSWRMWRPS